MLAVAAIVALAVVVAIVDSGRGGRLSHAILLLRTVAARLVIVAVAVLLLLRALVLEGWRSL